MAKEEIITKIIPVFRHYGYEGTTMSRLSAATGLKKASLYHHFKGGKEEMAQEALQYVSNWIEENIFAPLDSDKPAKLRIIEMSRGIELLYKNGKTPCLLAIMSFGEADNLFHQQLKQSLDKWLQKLSQVVEEIGIEPTQAYLRAENAMMMIQGSLVLVRLNQDIEPFTRVINLLPQILLEQ